MNLRAGRGRFLMWLVMDLTNWWPLTVKVYHKKQSILFVETNFTHLWFDTKGQKPPSVQPARLRQTPVNYTLATVSPASLSGPMDLCFDLVAALDRALAAAASSAGLSATGFAPGVRTADPVHGDFQANGVLAYARQQRQNPRGVALALVAQLGRSHPVFRDCRGRTGIQSTSGLKPAALLAWLSRTEAAPRSLPERRRPNRATRWSWITALRTPRSRCTLDTSGQP